jgi:peptide/nickel transport system substrate-binding protein
MSDQERDPRWWESSLNRRTLLRGGMLGGVGLAAAALIGCGGGDDDDDDDETPVATPATGGAAATSTPAAAQPATTPAEGGGMLVQDPNLPYPYQFPEPATTPKPGGTLKVGVTFDVANFDPTVSSAGGTITVPNMTYNRLLGFVGGPNFDPFNLELEGELASSWERTPDGTTFTFQIRDDVNWQNIAPLNGRKFVSGDAKYAHDRYAAEGAHKSYWANISSTEAPDDTTYKINMGTVTADFILPLASRYQTIFPRETVEDGSIEQTAVGTGPMILTEVAQGSHMNFVKNPDYWERDVLLDGAEFLVQRDASARLAAFRVGQIDYGYTLGNTKSLLEELLETNPDVQVNLVPVTSSWTFGMNLSNPKFQDVRVRRAMTLAIDSSLIRSVIYDDFAKSLTLQPWIYAVDEEPSAENGLLGEWNPRYDPDEAKKLLTAAGVENLSFESMYYIYGAYITQHTEILLSNFADVGIEMSPNSVDYTEFNSTWIPRKLEEASTSAWQTAGFDTDNYFYNSVFSESPGNRWNLNDPKVDELAKAQQVELDPTARKEIVREMWDYFLDQMFWPPLASGIQIVVYQPWLRGFRFGGPNTSSSYYYDWGDQVAGAWLDK